MHGSRLCGKVRLELGGMANFINHCRCSKCRTARGAASSPHPTCGDADNAAEPRAANTAGATVAADT